jgi:hypothetical protein
VGKKMTDEFNPYLTKSNTANQTSDAGTSGTISLLSRADVNEHGQRTQLAVEDVKRLYLLPSKLVMYHGSRSQIKVNA